MHCAEPTGGCGPGLPPPAPELDGARPASLRLDRTAAKPTATGMATKRIGTIRAHVLRYRHEQGQEQAPQEAQAGRRGAAQRRGVPGSRRAGTSSATASRRRRRGSNYSLRQDELARLQLELLKLQEWVRHRRACKVVVIFEGRDAAGKGGVIKRITESLNPRICRIVALGTPTERERGQWYFQRYVAQLPPAGEIVLFDRSWYNRAGVEHVMGFCTDDEYASFCALPAVRGDAGPLGHRPHQVLVSVSDEEQEKRFQERMSNPSSAGSSAPWTSSRASTGWSTPGQGRDARPHRHKRAPGTSSTPTTRSARA